MPALLLFLFRDKIQNRKKNKLNMVNILVFGDSIAWGAFDLEKGGWVDRLKLYMADRGDIFVYNLGVSGNNTADILTRFESEARARVDEDEETIIIFAVGINDSHLLHRKNGLVVLMDDFELNIKRLAGLARRFSSKIVFIGLTPVDESKTVPIPWDKTKSYKNDDISEYDRKIRSLSREMNCFFVEIFNDWINFNHIGLLEDGLHPNSEGHKKIFESVRDLLVHNKIVGF